MTELDTRQAGGPDKPRRRSIGGLVSILVLLILALVPALYIALLLSLSIDGYQTYTAASIQPGDNASLNAGEERLGIVVASFAFVLMWFIVTGIAAAIAAATGWPVVRTVVYVGGGLALVVGVLVVAWLTAAPS
ncbi:MAG: hypothetical protein ACRDT9_01095 [Agromyces sp.]